MKHRVSGKKLNRDTQHRRGLYKNLISSLLIYGKINTTLAKAKAVQPQVEKLVTKAKKGTLHHRRQIDQVLNKTTLVNKLVDSIAPKTGDRYSGFTRIVKLGRRSGDNAFMARIEFVDPVVEEPVKATLKPAKEAVVAKKTTTKAKSPSPKKTETKAKAKTTTKKEVANE
jgi:large subunit ribosomal protein L17